MPLDYAGADSKPGWIVIARFRDAIEAHLAASRLSADDVEAQVTDHRTASGLGRWPGSLAVRAEDAFKAAAILRTTPARDRLVDAFREEPNPDP